MEFRAMARQQIDKYQLATFRNKKVTQLRSTLSNGFPVFTAVDADGKTHTARRVVLATGVTDILPDTPGVMDAYGKGMYWVRLYLLSFSLQKVRN